MKLVIALLCILPLVYSQSDDEWINFQVKYGKVYRSTEEPIRRAIWEDKIKQIKKHNEEAARGLHTYTLGENSFSDLTWEEFKQQKLGYRRPVDVEEPVHYHQMSGRASSKQVDLRKLGSVTAVKDQGQCGSCWAFSSTAALETAWANVGNDLIELSEQQLVDCATSTPGCNGGWMNPTFEYIKKNGGHQTAKSYPYTATNGTCKQDGRYNVAQVNGAKTYITIPVKNEAALQDAVEAGFAVSVAVYVESTFQSYKDGIYSRAASFFEALFNLNHAITIVGYDVTDSKNGYYIAKNSWGKSWGDQGYILLKSGQDTAACLQKASYPHVV